MLLRIEGIIKQFYHKLNNMNKENYLYSIINYNTNDEFNLYI